MRRVLLGVAVATLLLLVILSRPAGWGVAVGTPGDWPVLANFFGPERHAGSTFRWSGLESRLLLANAGASPVILRMRLQGDLLAARADPRLLLERAGRRLVDFVVAPGWRTYAVVLPAGPTLDLTTTPYCPATADNRVLGVPLAWVQVVPTPGGPLVPARLLPLQWALLAGWGLLLVGLTAGQVLRGGLTGLVFGLSAGGLLLAGWLAPVWLVRALDFAPLPLAGATLLLLATWPGSRRLLRRVGGWLDATLPGAGCPRLRWLVLAVGGWLLAHLALLLPAAVPLAPGWRDAAAWVVLLTPGLLLGWGCCAPERDGVVRLFFAVCGGLALVALLLLALHWLPGAVPWWLLLLACDLLSVGALAWLWWRPHALEPEEAAAHLPPLTALHLAGLVVVLLLAAAFRLPLLGSAEFSGDEARAMVLAMGIAHGQDEMVLLHRKGPVEALLPAAPLVLTGYVDEAAARLPFALAGMATLLGAFGLARRLVGALPGDAAGRAALVAVAILALDGFLIGFARIVQYQSVVLCMAAGALLAAWRFYEGAQQEAGPLVVRTGLRYLLLAAVFGSVGLLAHYDGIYVLPAVAWLVLAGALARYRRARRQGDRRAGVVTVGLLGLPLGLALLLLASFYLPFVLHEEFGATLAYLTERTGQQADVLVNNLPAYFARATFYMTVPQVVLLAAMLFVGGLVWVGTWCRPWPVGLLLMGGLTLGVALLVGHPASLQLAPGLNLALVFFALPLAGLALAPATPAALRTLVLWFGVPFLAHAFIIGDPRTHFYTLDTAAALLAALALVQAGGWMRRLVGPRLLWAAGGTLAGLVGLFSLPYLYLLFVQQVPEYYRTFPAARPAIYSAHYGDEVPPGGHFGFPRRDGWKVVGELYRRGLLEGSYHSNQWHRVSTWYTRGAPQCTSVPDYYFKATWAGAGLPATLTDAPDAPDYRRMACVLVDGMRMMDIYTSEPASVPDRPRAFVLADYVGAFDGQEVPDFPPQQVLHTPFPQRRLAAPWPQGITLRGYDLHPGALARGEGAALLLYWDLAGPLPAPYRRATLQVELVGPGGGVVAAVPDCRALPPGAWSTRYTNTTAFTLRVAAPLSPGAYRLRVRLVQPGGGTLLYQQPLTTVQVR